MRTWQASAAEDLLDLPIHDAWFDPDEVRHEPRQQRLVVPFAQEPALCGYDAEANRFPLPVELRETWWARELKVPLLAGALVIDQVQQWSAEPGWGDMGMLVDISFEPGPRQLVLTSNGELRATVHHIAVRAQMQPEIVGYLRRRINKHFGGTWDRPWN